MRDCLRKGAWASIVPMLVKELLIKNEIAGLLLCDDRHGPLVASVPVDIVVAVALQNPTLRSGPTGGVPCHRRLADPHGCVGARCDNAGTIISAHRTHDAEPAHGLTRKQLEAKPKVVSAGAHAINHGGVDRPARGAASSTIETGKAVAVKLDAVQGRPHGEGRAARTDIDTGKAVVRNDRIRHGEAARNSGYEGDPSS